MKEDIDAPGLKWRPRAGGLVPYWIARADLVKRGFKPSTVRLHYEPHEREAIAHRCRVLQAEMLEWANIGAAERGFDGTIGGLIAEYETNEHSPYHKVRHITRVGYGYDLKKLNRAVGKRRLDSVTFKDLARWHAEAKKPKKPGGQERVRAAHGLMTMLRMIISFGCMMELPDCARIDAILKKMRFEQPSPRSSRPTLEQVAAIIATAHDLGAHSIALGQALQFEGMFRQSDVTGLWEPSEGEGGIRLNRQRWVSGLTWAHLGPDGVIRLGTNKTTQRVEIDTTQYPMLRAEIDRVPPEKRIGPMVVDERSGLPYADRAYSKRWRWVADAAGLPKDVWNRDSRAGGITEGRAAGASIEDVAKQAAHSDPSITSRVYDRSQLDASRRVAEKRVAHRNKA